MNRYNPNIHHRRSIRLKGYDYSQAGLYFITICVQHRECLFGHIAVGVNPCGCPGPRKYVCPDGGRPEMILNDAGKMVETEWLHLKTRFSNIELHEYVVMPNHFHGILEIIEAPPAPVRVSLVDTQHDRQPQQGQPQGIAPTLDIPIGATTRDCPNKTVGDMMDAFKSITTVEYIRGVKNSGWKPFNGKLWQRNYYEHIIRNEKAYENISEYILNNPTKWHNDKFFNK
jgi:REP element-mobilizing transposase RayT